MASDIYLKLTGIDGEAQDSAHTNEIEILSYSLGVSNQGSGAVGKGSGAAKSDFTDVSLSKVMDKSSVGLALACATGKHIDEATLTVRKAAGDTPLDYLKIKLTEVFVTSFHNAASDGGGIAQESLSLNFSKIEFTYNPQGSAGSGEGDVVKSYNVKTHEAT
jgi:type VI secretion system secreted protein Hcp